MRTPSYSVKQSFFWSSSTWTVQNSLDNTDAHMPLTQDCPPSLIEPTIGHYSSTGTHSTSFWLAFPGSVQQERALECTSEVLKGTQIHTAKPTRNIPEASEVGTPHNSSHFRWLHIREISLYVHMLLVYTHLTHCHAYWKYTGSHQSRDTPH